MPHQHHAGHQHHHMEKRQDQGTVVQYVYKTAAKTFDGPVGGYSTVNPPSAESTPDSSSSNSDSNSDSNSNSNSNSQQQQEQQQAAQQSAAAAAAESSSALAAEVAQASSTAVAAAEASMESAAAASQQTQKADTPTQAAVKATATSKAQVKETPTSNTLEATPTPTVAAATSSSPTVASTPTSSFIDATESASSSKPSHTAAPSKDSSGGMSGGAKAGLAIGILLIIGLLVAGIFLCYRRRKKHENAAYGKADDEKSAYAGSLARAQSTTSTRTTATAPRLSLRPVTQFLPDLAARGKAANAAGAAAGGATAGAAMASRDHNDLANPFGNHAEVAQPSQTFSENEKTALPIQANTPENPFADTAGAPLSNADRSLAPAADVPAPLRVRTPTPEAAAAAGAGAIGAGAGVIAGAKLAERHNAPKPLNLSPNRSVSPAAASPAVSEFSQTPASPGTMANGPPPSNVHRIQLDFKPSMEDELSLRAGQLVRLLHEYDDGWVSIHLPGPSYALANVPSRLSAFVSIGPNRVSPLVLVFQLVQSSLALHLVPVDLVLAGLRQA